MDTQEEPKTSEQARELIHLSNILEISEAEYFKETRQALTKGAADELIKKWRGIRDRRAIAIKGRW